MATALLPLYAKLSTTAADAEAEEVLESGSSSDGGMLEALLERCGLAGSGDDDIARWRPRVEEAWWYQLSSFAYCVAGGVTLLHPEPLERHMVFPWRCMGLSVFMNGFASYMADVETWGRPSAWRLFDRVLATTNVLLQCAVVASALLGDASFPPESPAVLGGSVLVALACKQRAVAAFRRGDCDAYLRWHAAWHYTLPAGAVAAQCFLHKACDYALALRDSCHP